VGVDSRNNISVNNQFGAIGPQQTEQHRLSEVLKNTMGLVTSLLDYPWMHKNIKDSRSFGQAVLAVYCLARGWEPSKTGEQIINSLKKPEMDNDHDLGIVRNWLISKNIEVLFKKESDYSEIESLMELSNKFILNMKKYQRGENGGIHIGSFSGSKKPFAYKAIINEIIIGSPRHGFIEKKTIKSETIYRFETLFDNWQVEEHVLPGTNICDKCRDFSLVRPN
jgi:hypothetical protein